MHQPSSQIEVTHKPGLMAGNPAELVGTGMVAAGSLPGRAKIESKVLQASRAVAALLVVIYHVNESFFGNTRYWTDRPLGHFFGFGHAGVDFFFVLSGFIMYSAHRRDIGMPARLKSFVWKRFRRIYPVYWLVLLATVLLFFAVPGSGQGFERDPRVILASTLLVHVFGQTGEVVLVSWTLFHEMVFYGLFALLILNRRCGVAALGLWMLGSMASLLWGASISAALEFYLSPLHLLFGMGIAAAWLINTSRVPAAAAMLLAGCAAFLGIGMEEVYGGYLAVDVSHVLYGVASTAILLGAVEVERSGRLRIPAWLVFLGDASYSIYLCHDMALSALAKFCVVVTASVSVPLVIVYAGLVAAAVTAGVVFHLVAEAPLLALLSVRRRAVTVPVELAALRLS